MGGHRVHAGLDRSPPRWPASWATSKGLVDGGCALTPDGEAALELLRVARRGRVEALLSDWEPERHDEILQIVQRLTQSLAEEPPEPAAATVD